MTAPLRLTARVARNSRHKWAFHVAFVMRGGNIIATGNNHGWTHAEVAALESLWPSEREGTKLWSLRVGRDGQFRRSKPCKNCMKAIRESGVKSIHYHDENLKLVKERL